MSHIRNGPCLSAAQLATLTEIGEERTVRRAKGGEIRG
jgi:hypothetical protein